MVSTEIKAAWIGSEVGAVVLGLRAFDVTPIVDLVGSGGPTTAIFAAFGLAGAVSLADKLGVFDSYQ